MHVIVHPSTNLKPDAPFLSLQTTHKDGVFLWQVCEYHFVDTHQFGLKVRSNKERYYCYLFCLFVLVSLKVWPCPKRCVT